MAVPGGFVYTWLVSRKYLPRVSQADSADEMHPSKLECVKASPAATIAYVGKWDRTMLPGEPVYGVDTYQEKCCTTVTDSNEYKKFHLLFTIFEISWNFYWLVSWFLTDISFSLWTHTCEYCHLWHLTFAGSGRSGNSWRKCCMMIGCTLFISVSRYWIPKGTLVWTTSDDPCLLESVQK